MVRTAAIGALSKIGFVACLALGTTQAAYAATIALDNDVDIDWSLAGSDCENVPQSGCPADPVVVGAPRLVLNASGSGNLVFIEVSNIEENVSSILLGLNVFFDDGTPVLVPFGSDQLRLGTVTISPFLLPDSDGDGEPEFKTRLGDFANFDDLPDGIPLIFTVFADFAGSGDARGQSLGLITVSGAGTEISQVEIVPEPSTLLLLGSGMAALIRRKTFRRARS